MERQPFDDIRALIGELTPADEAAAEASLARLHRVAPAGTLGALEDVVRWLGGWRGGVAVNRPIIALYAGAHAGGGDIARTRAQLEAIAAGAAAVSRAAQHLGAGLDVFDLAIDRPVGDFRRAATMSERECAATMAFGMEALAKQPDLLILGALGDGIEASAVALAGALTEDASLVIDTEAAARARLEARGDPLQILRQIGGRETAAIVGAILAAGSQGTPVLLDGPSAAAAAGVLHAISPAAIAHCRLGCAIADPAVRALLDRLPLAPLFDLGVTLSDGTGSTAALSLIKLTCALPLEAKA